MIKFYQIVRRWPEAVWRLLYPPRCLICKAVLEIPDPLAPPCCRKCLADLPPARLYCPHCGSFNRDPGPCCPDGGSLRSLFALSLYQGEWRKMLHRLKYRGERRLSRPLGNWLGTALLETGWSPDLITFIPLHPRKALERGYNQSELIARRVAGVLGLPLIPILKKIKDTPSQTELSRIERYKNAEGAFASIKFIPPGSTVLLVDDIYTTGATMKGAAEVLSRAGATVYGAVAAFQSHIC